MNIKLIRLSSGEDIIGDLSYQDPNDPDAITIENPCLVYIAQGTPGKGAQIGMTRWMPYADNKVFSIKKAFIVTDCDPVDDLRQQYDSVFGSGLIVPKKGLTLVDK